MNELSIELVKSKLNVGDILSYKDICTILEQPYFRGNQKNSQLKEFQRYFDFKNIDRKFFIKEIYDECKPKGCRSSYINYKQFLLTYEEGKKNGVYIIQKENKVYIGSTITSFRSRFLEHIEKKNKSITYDMLHDGATFSVLWFADENDEEYVIREKEEQYIKHYIELNEYDVLNTRMETYTKNLLVEQNKEYNELKLSNKYNGKTKYKSLKLKKKDIDKVKKFCEENNIKYK